MLSHVTNAGTRDLAQPEKPDGNNIMETSLQLPEAGLSGCLGNGFAPLLNYISNNNNNHVQGSGSILASIHLDQNINVKIRENLGIPC